MLKNSESNVSLLTEKTTNLVKKFQPTDKVIIDYFTYEDLEKFMYEE